MKAVSLLHVKAVRDVARLRGPVIAIALVAMCGIATFVTMRSAFHAILSSRASYYQLYRFADVFASVRRAPESLAIRIRDLPGVGEVETRLIFEANLDVPDLAEPATGRLISTPRSLNLLHLRSGNLPVGLRDVVVSESFALANGLRAGGRLGANLNGRWVDLHITAVAISPEYIYEVSAGALFPDNRRFGVLWMSREALESLYQMDGAFNAIALRLTPGASESEVIARLDQLLTRYGSQGAIGRADQTSHHFISNEIQEIRTTTVMVPSIFLAITAFLTHVILTRLVAMQRDQIAVLKAFGFSNRTVFFHYFEIALVPVLAGALGGLAVGTWLGGLLADLYQRYFRFPALITLTDWPLIAESLLIALAAAAAGVALPVRFAVRLPPAEAMQPPRPANFRRGLLERLGLSHVLPLTARMILRNLTRRPLRSMLSVAAMGCAVAVLLLGRLLTDSVSYLMYFQFELVSREDSAVVFHDLESLATRFELARAPGVWRVEPFRTVPIRLRHGHRTYRTALQGLDPAADLHLLLDQRERRVPLPSEGIVVTAKLAEMLQVRSGDSLTVEVLEGRRPVRDVRVASTVDELIGLTAYASLPYLDRLLGEEPARSGAYLAVDPSRSTQLYARLKHTPGVAAIVARQAMLSSFRRTFAESMGLSTTFLMGFAIVIAFSVVFNSVRVALSERSHELASLRVLGFRRGEMAVVLLGEQLCLLLLAIPAGFLMGRGLCEFLVAHMESELFRLPVMITLRSHVLAAVIVLMAAAFSGVVVARGIWRLDLIEALKNRE